MSTAALLAVAIGIGITAGLRSMTPLAIVALAARWKTIDLDGSILWWMGSTAAAVVLPLLALGELIADKLPFTPSRKTPVPFAGRVLSGALSAGAVSVAAGHSLALGAAAGAAGAVLGTLGGYEARTRSVRALRVPDFAIALLEDVVAVGGCALLVLRPW